MNEKKVLISAPIAGFKQYSINEWLNWIANQDYENISICLCTNGKNSKELYKLCSQIKVTHKNGKHVPLILLDLPNSEQLTPIQNITFSRELIRREAKRLNYDYLFYLDTDTIPINTNTIQTLIDQNKEIISGLYFYKNTHQAVALDEDTGTNFSEEKLKNAYEKNTPIKAWGFGFGCLLIHKNIYQKHAFDYNLFGENKSDDFGYCELLHQNKIQLWLHPKAICTHLSNPERRTKFNEMITIEKNEKEELNTGEVN